MQSYQPNKKKYLGAQQKGFSPKIEKFIGQLLLVKQKIDLPKKQFFNNVKILNQELENFKLVKCADILDNILDSKQKLRLTISIAHCVMDRIINLKLRPVFLNAYVHLIKRHQEYVGGVADAQQLSKLAGRINIKDLGYFCESFNLSLQKNTLLQVIEQLSKNKQYSSALKLISLHPDKKQLLEILSNYAKSEEDKRNLDYVIEQIVLLGFKKQDFINLHEAGIRLQMYYIYQNDGFQYAEEVYLFYPKIMALILDKLISDKRNKEVVQFCARNPQLINQIRDKNLSQKIKNEVQNLQLLMNNSLRTDRFEPSNTKQYFSLKDFGINQHNVFFINSQTPNLEHYLENIINSEVLGLDTQSYVARSKFSTDLELISTIQISNGTQAYIFDAKDISNHIIGQTLAKFFYSTKKILVGHTLKQDLQATLKALGIKENSQCQTIDVKQDFKNLYPGQKAGLTAISEAVLGKPICKKYTVTNWQRRPLFKNQIHYAALDAVIVLHINKKLRQKKSRQKL